MTIDKPSNLKLVGEGSASGGVYETIRVTGQGSIIGDVSSKKAKIVGECTIKGNAEVEQFSIIGKGEIEGDIYCERLKLTGDIQIKNKFKASHVHARGYITSNGNIEIEKMNIKGGFNINGMLNVGELKIDLQLAPSFVREIGGEKITITRRSLINRSSTLEVELIEGDEIYLEYTSAQMVRGDVIVIGPGCHINQVEYRSSYKNKQKYSENIKTVIQI